MPIAKADVKLGAEPDDEAAKKAAAEAEAEAKAKEEAEAKAKEEAEAKAKTAKATKARALRDCSIGGKPVSCGFLVEASAEEIAAGVAAGDLDANGEAVKHAVVPPKPESKKAAKADDK